MDLNRHIREADEQIRKLVARYNQLYAPDGTISQIELDLMLDEMRKLYETFKTIGNINQARLQHLKKPEITVQQVSATNTQQPNLPGSGLHKPHTSHESHPAKPQSGSDHVTTDAHPEQEASANDPLPEMPEKTKEEPGEIPVEEIEKTDHTAVAENEPTQQTVKEKPVAETISNNNPATLADKFQQVNKSLSETISAKSTNEPVGTRIAFHPISDLSTGIGLNDKFSFISDLFGNNAAVYDEAITRINKAVNLDEANWILQKYHSQDWSQKTESHHRLKEFIKRRFI